VLSLGRLQTDCQTDPTVMLPKDSAGARACSQAWRWSGYLCAAEAGSLSRGPRSALRDCPYRFRRRLAMTPTGARVVATSAARLPIESTASVIQWRLRCQLHHIQRRRGVHATSDDCSLSRVRRVTYATAVACSTGCPVAASTTCACGMIGSTVEPACIPPNAPPSPPLLKRPV